MHLIPLWTLLTWTLALLSIALMLLRPRGIPEAYWVCGGALLLVATRCLSVSQAGYAIREGLDVYLFLTGMMILAEIAREEHVFEWLADVAASHAKRSSARLFLLIYLAGTVVTVLLSNDATAVVLTPAVLAVVRRARVASKPYLLACAFIANAASFVFPISNPANLVVFGAHLPRLASWLHIFLLPSIGAILVTFLCFRWIFRTDLQGLFAGEVENLALTPDGKRALSGLLLSAVVLMIASALGWPLGAPTCVTAMVAIIVVGFHDRNLPLRAARGISWSVLPLVAGLFVIMEALQNAGMLRMCLAGLRWLEGFPHAGAQAVAASSAALLSNVMNNLPVGLVGGAAIRAANETGVVAHAVLIGVDVGPNLSVTGSLATILWLIAMRRENVEITAWEFLKVGVIVMPLSLAATLLLLWN